MENVITLGKLIGLLFLFSSPSLYFVFENSRNELARHVMGSIFLVTSEAFALHLKIDKHM